MAMPRTIYLAPRGAGVQRAHHAITMPLLADIGVPVLVTHGREDRLLDFIAAEEIAADLPNAQLYAFEGKGHLPIFTATAEFCEVLRRFVRTGTVTTCTIPS
jgi:pimeloyl-ACP methyl ester carboxylesterase